MKPKEFDYIKICLGYPSDDQRDKIIWRKWNGLKIGKFETGLFGNIHCIAIDVSSKIYKDQFLAPYQVFKRILTLNLKREYFEEIRDDKKHWEYREYKPFWIKRLFELDGQVIKEFPKLAD